MRQFLFWLGERFSDTFAFLRESTSFQFGFADELFTVNLLDIIFFMMIFYIIVKYFTFRH